MPEHLFPGVFVEDLGTSPTPIEGVPTGTCAFVGATRKGRAGAAPRLLTSFSDFKYWFGGLDDLKFAGDAAGVRRRNYLAHAVQVFFNNGGGRLYVVRVTCGMRTNGAGLVAGAPDYASEYTAAFARLEGIAEVSVVAAPGYSAWAPMGDGAVYRAIQAALLKHVEDPLRYRMAVLDAPPAASPQQMQDLAGLMDSSRAAVYYPWVVVANPFATAQPAEIALPPSGFICGIYARNDTEHGVHHAPANMEVLGAVRFERNVSEQEQAMLNPVGVNCLRAFTGRGLRVWGARTISKDREWIYVNHRRYFNYLGASIERGIQWTVFEPNGEGLWARVRATVANFLHNQWATGALPGNKPDLAFFVRCDRTTMTQVDIDSDRLICLIGVAPLKPAEFVMQRIGVWTADAKR
jgi:uncharacterized protein